MNINNNGTMVAEPQIDFESLELAVLEPTKYYNNVSTINCNKSKGIVNISNVVADDLALTNENFARILNDKENNRLFLQCSGFKQPQYIPIKRSKNGYLYFRINKQSPIDEGRYFVRLEPFRIKDKEGKMQLLYELTKM